jgi:hypothetical protein
LEDRRRAAVAVLASLSICVLGCGGGGGQRVPDSDAARAAVLGFARAFGSGDAKKACNLLTDAARAAFLKRVQTLVPTKDCSVAMTKVHDEAGADVTQAFTTATAGNVRLKGGAATVTLTASGHSTTVGLAKQGGEWKLTGVPGI